jgi:hypothetical protein
MSILKIGIFLWSFKIADRNLFQCDFVIPSQTLRRPFAQAQGFGSGLWLRASAQGFGSGQRLRERKRPKNPFLSERPYSVILTLSLSEGEESPPM